MPHVAAGDLQVYYEEHGAGFPVLAIMGLAANADWWPPAFVEPLARKWRLIPFDNRGAGRTRGDHSNFSVPLAAQDTLRLLDALKIEQAHVIGMSMGGMIAQEVALAAPERVGKLVLCGTNSGLRLGGVTSLETWKLALRYAASRETRRRARTLNLLFTPEFLAANKGRAAEFDERVRRAPITLAAYKKQIAAVIKFNTRKRLKDIRSPTLVITGTRDILVPHVNSRRLAAAIPNARLVQLPNTGHGFLVDAAERAAQEIGAFLAEP